MAKTLQNNVLNYLGVRATNPPEVLALPSAPTSAFTNYDLYTFGVFSNNLYFLSSFSGTGATWLALGGAGIEIETITVDGPTVVSPVANNVNLVGGTGITVTAVGNTITVNAVGEGEKTVVSTSGPVTVVKNTRYVQNAGGAITFNLPASAGLAVGDAFGFMLLGAGSFVIQCAGSQVINSPTNATTAGGTVTSGERYDAIEFVYVATDTFIVQSLMGVPTYA